MSQTDYIGYIYCITNCANGKKYIGQTSTSIHKRFIEHLRCARTYTYENTLLYRAIRKYGEDKFIVDEVERVVGENREHLKFLLNEQEMFYIANLNTYKPYGYNMTIGGDSFADHVVRRVCKVDHYGNVVDCYESMAEADRKNNLPSGSVKRGISSENHYASGWFWYDASDELNIGDNIGKQRSYLVPVYCFTLEGALVARFNSIVEASATIGACHSHISAVCAGHRLSSGGYLWSYTATPPVYNSRQFTHKNKPVQQMSQDGITISVFPSIESAARELGLQPSLISACCRGRRKSTGGYRWAFQYIKEEN